MNYRDFFKNKKTTAKDIQNLIPEGVDPKEFQKGIIAEIEHTQDQLTAATIASKNLQADANYYSKIQEVVEDEEEEGCEEGSVEEHCGACEDDMGSEYDENGGLPKVGGALAVPHHGQPIMMGKIIQVGKEFGGKPQTGELSGMTKVGVAKDRGGIPANQQGDKEPLTAGGKKLETSVASKSVGGPVAPGEGQKQGGLNSQGTIANTARLDESKNKVRKIVKEVLKEIKFDKGSGKWMKINEGKHKTGCTCGFCKNKGTFGKKSKKDDEKEEMDEATVDMKMGPSYKVVQPTLAKTSEPDQFSRTNEYDPEVSEGEEQDEVGGQIVQHRSYRTIRDVPQNPEARWSDEIDEVGGHMVQHRSYVTANDAPQDGKVRWGHEVDEGSKKPSKVVKSIQKGMKPKTTLKNPKLKFQKSKKTTSGVHKRKP